MLDASILVFLDSDTVVIAEPTDLDFHRASTSRFAPPTRPSLNSRGPGDAIDAYWERVFRDRARRRSLRRDHSVDAFGPSYAGLIAVRREAGVFREWEHDFRRLIGGIIPKGALQNRIGRGRADRAGRPPVRPDPAVDIRYNYLIYRPRSWSLPSRLPLDKIIHIHYRFAFYKHEFLKTVQPPFDQDSEVFRWLDDHLPLEPTIDEAEDTSQFQPRPEARSHDPGQPDCVVRLHGPSLDRLSAVAWGAIARPGRSCRSTGRWPRGGLGTASGQYAAAIDVATGLCRQVPGFAELGGRPRLARQRTGRPPKASRWSRREWWSDAPDEGYVGGSTAMVVGNWICNPGRMTRNHRAICTPRHIRAGKPIPPRGFRRVSYVGLDMIIGQGGHAEGVCLRRSGFSFDLVAYQHICDGWRRFASAAPSAQSRSST